MIISYIGNPLIGFARCPVEQCDNTVHIVTPEKVIQFVCQALHIGTQPFQFADQRLDFGQGVDSGRSTQSLAQIAGQLRRNGYTATRPGPGEAFGSRLMLELDMQVPHHTVANLLKSLKHLKEVILWNTRVTQQGAEALQAVLPACDVSTTMFE